MASINSLALLAAVGVRLSSVLQSFSVDSPLRSLIRISLNVLLSVLNPFCLITWFNMITFVNNSYIVWPCEPVPSGANNGRSPTGGNCAKSPIRITDMSPNGVSSFVVA